MIRAWLLYTGADGNSRVSRGVITSEVWVAADSIRFQETPAHSSLDWHTAPHHQYVITLSGTLEFTTAQQETFIIHPGDVLVATDLTGSGHKWRLIDDQPWRRAYVIFREGADPQFIPDEP